MKKICIIGAGFHSRGLHLPALQLFAKHHPNQFKIEALADLDTERARQAAEEFSIPRYYSDAEEMLDAGDYDACLAFTGMNMNAKTTIGLMQRGITTLMEKPLGMNLPEAREVIEIYKATGTPVMVSMNRRYDPQLNQALEWIREQGCALHYIHSTMERYERREAQFISQTGVHIVDVTQMIGGALTTWSSRRLHNEDENWTQIHLEFARGIRGTVDIIPSTGRFSESIELMAENLNVLISSTIGDRGWSAWKDGELVRQERVPQDTPEYVANGTYAETIAFMNNLASGSPFWPTPLDVWTGTEICQKIVAAPDGIVHSAPSCEMMPPPQALDAKA